MSAAEIEKMECQELEEYGDDSDEDSEDDDNDDQEEEKDEEELRSRVTQLRKQIAGNNLYYDGHVNLIAALRELAELEEARKAREEMSKVYPLSPELWLDWLRDEQKVCTTKEEREFIKTLFDRSVKDYTSVQLWVEYVMFMIGGGIIEETRAVAERALTAVGTHVAEGILIWQVVLLVEKQIYAGLQKPGEVQSDDDKKALEKQLRRIQSFYRRQARVPLLNADPQVFLEEASEYFEGNLDPQIKVDKEKSQKKLSEKIPFEDELLKCESEVDKLAIYRRYIAHTQETDNPAAVHSLYERAVTELCLDTGLWEDYVRFVLRQFQGLDYVVLPVCERSQRNCPWSASLCVLHIRALQLFTTEDDSSFNNRIKGALEKGLGCGLQSGSEATRMWMAYLVYLRRLIKWDEPHDSQLDAFREACQQAIDMIDSSFGVEGDIDSDIPRFWARIEGEFAKNPERVREIWNDIIMKRNDNFKNASFWLEFINLERSYGTEKHCRKLFRRALERVWDHVELIGDAYLRFEQEAGPLETMEDFIKRYEERMIIVKRKRAEDAAKLEAEKQTEELGMGRQKDKGKKKNKKKFSTDGHTNGNIHESNTSKASFPVPKQAKGPKEGKGGHPGSKTSQPSIAKEDALQNSKVNDASVSTTSIVPPPGLKKNGASPPPGFKNDGASPPASKKNGEPPPGFKSDIAPPPGFGGDVAPPPGFDNEKSPPPGFKRKIEESEDEPETKKAKVSEIYGVPTHKDECDDLCTVFISNLDFHVGKDDIVTVFSKCGEIKDFRLVLDYKRRSKGFGYLVFKSQASIAKALELDRSPLNGRPIFVSKYDPEGHTHHFRYSTEIEKSKLFVRGLPFSMSVEDVKQAFLPHGDIKEIRLVTYRNGLSKGTCYIDYYNAETADKVRQAMDGVELQGKVISVLISNPPSKDKLSESKPMAKEVSLGGGGQRKRSMGGRGKGMFDLMPRSLMRASNASSESSTSTAPAATDSSVQRKSNEDFRKMFLNK